MDTKLKADIAESAAITQLLKRGFQVLRPIGDRLPYDLVAEYEGSFLKIQVKSAWFRKGSYIVDNRRTKTNRRRMMRSPYENGDFDFAILHIDDLNVSYVMPFNVFSSYKSEITLIERDSRQRKPKSCTYREAWDLLHKGLFSRQRLNDNLSNSVKPQNGDTEPMPQVFLRKGVETRRQTSATSTSADEGIVQTTNPSIFSGGAAKAEVGCITRRSLVQIQPPLPK